MAGGNLAPNIERRIREAWGDFFAETLRMGGDARPKQAVDIFKIDESDRGISVTVKPVTFRVKEKSAHKRNSIFVTVSGHFIFSPESTKDDLRVANFATRVAYFREVELNRLKHVYGIHYDFDDELPAHPVYHCQIAPMTEFVTNVNEAHNRKFNAVADEDNYVKGLLGNVRIPTAHMDPFSVFLQIIGDHLVSEVNDEGRQAFVRAQTAVSGFKSKTSAPGRLAAVHEGDCFRSHHWYRDARHQA